MPRPRPAWTAVALVTAPLAVTAPAAAAAAGYSIAVGPRADGPAIADSMYGGLFEDVDVAADGGLDAEPVRNRSFEFRPVSTRTFAPHSVTFLRIRTR